MKLWEAINQLSKNDDGMYQEQIVRRVLKSEDWLNLTTSAILLNEDLLGAFDVVAPLLSDMLSVKKLKKCIVTKIIHHRGEFATHEEVEFVSHFEQEYHREVSNDRIGGPYIIEFLKFHSKKPSSANN